MYSAAYVWAKVINRLEEQFSAVTVSAWFDDAEPVELNENALILHTPSDFRRETILKSFKAPIEAIVKELLGRDITLEVWNDAQYNAQTPAAPALWTHNPQFSFSTFVPGQENLVPYKAAQYVAELPTDSAYNPLYLYGRPGVGKTHLLYAIANRAAALYPDANIVYIKGDQFTNELIQAIRQAKTAEFKDKYRKADLLLIDDIQFISGKEATQEEFFNTFNSLYETHKQIVMTCDRAPKELTILDDRLRSRFGSGITLKIEAPDRDTRAKIIRAKAGQLDLSLTEEIVNYLSEKLRDDVRQLIGGLFKIRAFVSLSGMQLTPANVAKTVEDIQTTQSCAVVTPKLVVRYVSSYYGIEESRLMGSQRSKNITEPRQIAMFLTKQMTGMGPAEIGKYFGRHHTTVCHALEKVQDALGRSSDLRKQLEDIKRNIEANI